MKVRYWQKEELSVGCVGVPYATRFFALSGWLTQYIGFEWIAADHGSDKVRQRGLHKPSRILRTQ